MKKIIYLLFYLFFCLFFFFLIICSERISLRLFEGYAEQEWIDEFEAKYDAKVKVKYVGSVDELFALTQASKGGDFDLISIDIAYFLDTVALGLINIYDVNFQTLKFNAAFQDVKEVMIDESIALLSIALRIAWINL